MNLQSVLNKSKETPHIPLNDLEKIQKNEKIETIKKTHLTGEIENLSKLPERMKKLEKER